MKPSTIKAIVVFATLTAVFVVGFGFFLYRTFANMCGNETLAEFVSPDQAKKIIVFQRNCGATTGFSTQAFLVAINEKLRNQGGNVFAADTNHDAAPSAIRGGPELRVRWEGRNRLLLQHHLKARVFKAERHVDEIEIRYETFR